MDFAEFQKMLIDSFASDEIKSALRKMLADESVAEDIARFESRITELEESLAKAEKDLADKSEKYDGLLDEFNELAGTSAADKLKAEESEKTIVSLNEKIDELNSKLTAGDDAAKSSSDKLAQFTEQLDSAKRANEEKDARIRSLTVSENALKAQVESLNEAINELKNSMASSGSDKDAQIAELTAKVQKLEADAVAKDEHLASLKTDISAKTSEIEALKSNADEKSSRADELAAKVNRLETNTAEKDEQLVGLKSELDSKISELEALKASADESAVKISSLQQALDSAVQKADTALADAESARKVYAEAEAKIKEALDQVAQKDETIATMNTQLQGMLVLRQKINEYAETANAYAEEVENARAILAERDNQINSLSAHISELEAKGAQYEQSIATKNTQIEEIGKYAESLKAHTAKLDEQVTERNAEISAKINEIERLNKDIEAYKLTFGNLTSVFESYQNLTPATKQGLSDVFPSDINVRSFLSSGAQWGHIQALWEFTQQKINNEDLSDVSTLNDIFRYFLDFHNSSYDQPLYALLDTAPGEPYNEELHIKMMSREERKAAFFDTKKKAPVAEGPVKEVILLGYKNLKNGRVLKQSIVRL